MSGCFLVAPTGINNAVTKVEMERLKTDRPIYQRNRKILTH